VLLYGGGDSVSTPAVVRVDPGTAATHALHPLDESLSDLGAVRLRGSTYLVGGFTGTQYASAILRVGAHDRTTTVARLPTGMRYAGVATTGGKIYVAGGLTTNGESRAIYEFDPRGATVARIGSLPRPEAHAALAAVGGRLYLFGGRSVLRISPDTGAVARVATLPEPLADPNAVTVGRRIVVLGGGTNAVYALTADG
jgi:outer membrane protein assembly factor BamB